MTENTRIVKTFTPDTEHGRHSEGAFLRLKDGGILFAYTRYNGESAADTAPSAIVAVKSYDEGETWSEPKVLFTAEQYDVKTIGSVSLLRMENGDLGIFFLIDTVPGWTHHIIFARSNDEGETFYAESRDCTFDLYDGYFSLCNDSVRRLSSGRIIVPLTYNTGAYKDSPEAHVDERSFGGFTYSDDDGQTWVTCGDELYQTFSGTHTGLCFNNVTEIAPGVLKATFGTDMMCQYHAFSTDNGEHWTPVEPSVFSSPCAPMKVEKNPTNDKFYAIWNPVPNYNGRSDISVTLGRTPLVWAELSADTLRFGDINVIEGDPTCGYSNPAVFFTNDGQMLLAYNSGSEKDNGSCMAKLTIAKVRI